LISLLFTFGMGFMYMVMVNMAFWLIAYIVSLRLMLAGHRKRITTPNTTENL